MKGLKDKMKLKEDLLDSLEIDIKMHNFLKFQKDLT